MAGKEFRKGRRKDVVQNTVCRQENSQQTRETMWMLKKFDDGGQGVFYFLPNREYSIGRKGMHFL